MQSYSRSRILRKRHLLLCLSVLAALTGCQTTAVGPNNPTATPDHAAIKLELLHAGIFIGEYSKSYQVPDNSSTSGLRTLVNPVMICDSTSIPLEIGTTFGIFYRISGLPDNGMSIPVDVETRRPAIQGFDGRTSAVDDWQSETSRFAQGGHVGGAMFSFEQPFELQSGQWKIAVSAFDQTIAATFDVSSGHEPAMDNCHSLYPDPSTRPDSLPLL